MSEERNKYEAWSPTWDVLDQVLGKLRVLEFALIGLTYTDYLSYDERDIGQMAGYLSDILHPAREYFKAWEKEQEKEREQKKLIAEQEGGEQVEQEQDG